MSDDAHLTLRVSRSGIAAVVAVVVHVVGFVVVDHLPLPPKKEDRVSFTFTPPPPPPPPSSSPTPPPPPPPSQQPKKRKPAAPPSTSPVQPELPPSTEPPPENRAILPVTEVSPPTQPVPPPQPSSWKDHLARALAETAPPAAPVGPLAPSFANLARVANADPRLHDDENEARLAENYGPFFRRGLEALRSQWRPDEVLDREGVARRCARGGARTTRAVAVIDAFGNVVDVELKDASGCPELDDEAVAAFRRVARFPHPPKGLFRDPEGNETTTARMPVRFIVTFDGGIRLEW